MAHPVPRPRALAGRSLLALVAVVSLVLVRPALPCSICRCGDPTFGALGSQGYSATGWRLAFDWERVHKSEGPLDGDAEELIEHRLTALVAYGFSDRFSVYARVPWSFRSFTEIEEGAPAESFDTSGLSDPELYAQLRLWASAMSAPVGRRTSLSLQAGVKTALGQNSYEIDGERVDEHAQPGTGSTDLLGSVALLHLVDPRSSLFASVQYRRTGENTYGYRYGNAFLANVAYERKLGKHLDGVVELNYRWADADADDDEEVPNTGGALLYVTPRLLLDLGGGVVLRGAAQIPIVRSLNGVQDEKVVLNAGISVLFGS